MRGREQLPGLAGTTTDSLISLEARLSDLKRRPSLAGSAKSGRDLISQIAKAVVCRQAEALRGDRRAVERTSSVAAPVQTSQTCTPGSEINPFATWYS